MRVLDYKEWYDEYHSQNWLVKIEDAYELLDEHNLLSEQFDKEEFINDAMTAKYESYVSEYLDER